MRILLIGLLMVPFAMLAAVPGHTPAAPRSNVCIKLSHAQLAVLSASTADYGEGAWCVVVTGQVGSKVEFHWGTPPHPEGLDFSGRPLVIDQTGKISRGKS
jgi:hypothetical protein